MEKFSWLKRDLTASRKTFLPLRLSFYAHIFLPWGLHKRKRYAAVIFKVFLKPKGEAGFPLSVRAGLPRTGPPASLPEESRAAEGHGPALARDGAPGARQHAHPSRGAAAATLVRAQHQPGHRELRPPSGPPRAWRDLCIPSGPRSECQSWRWKL